MSSRSREHYESFTQTQKECKKAVRKAKRKFERSIATNCNKSPFNSYIKSKTKMRNTIGPLKVGQDLISK